MNKDYSDYLGIKFKHGSDDCYGLVRKFYKKEFGIELTDYARPDYWWNNGGNLYMENFRKEGFYIIDDKEDLQYGDLILMAIGSDVACHGALYIGEGKILQHLQGRESSIDKYSSMFKNKTVAVIRHKNVIGPRKIEYAFNKQTIDKFKNALF